MAKLVLQPSNGKVFNGTGHDIVIEETRLDGVDEKVTYESDACLRYETSNGRLSDVLPDTPCVYFEGWDICKSVYDYLDLIPDDIECIIVSKIFADAIRMEHGDYNRLFIVEKHPEDKGKNKIESCKSVVRYSDYLGEESPGVNIMANAKVVHRSSVGVVEKSLELSSDILTDIVDTTNYIRIDPSNPPRFRPYNNIGLINNYPIGLCIIFDDLLAVVADGSDGTFVVTTIMKPDEYFDDEVFSIPSEAIAGVTREMDSYISDKFGSNVRHIPFKLMDRCTVLTKLGITERSIIGIVDNFIVEAKTK